MLWPVNNTALHILNTIKYHTSICFSCYYSIWETYVGVMCWYLFSVLYGTFLHFHCTTPPPPSSYSHPSPFLYGEILGPVLQARGSPTASAQQQFRLAGTYGNSACPPLGKPGGCWYHASLLPLEWGVAMLFTGIVCTQIVWQQLRGQAWEG